MNAALRSIVWLGAVLWLAYLKKPDGAGILAVRTDAIGWIGGGLLVAGIVPDPRGWSLRGRFNT